MNASLFFSITNKPFSKTTTVSSLGIFSNEYLCSRSSAKVAFHFLSFLSASILYCQRDDEGSEDWIKLSTGTEPARFIYARKNTALSDNY